MNKLFFAGKIPFLPFFSPELWILCQHIIPQTTFMRNFGAEREIFQEIKGEY